MVFKNMEEVISPINILQRKQTNREQHDCVVLIYVELFLAGGCRSREVSCTRGVS